MGKELKPNLTVGDLRKLLEGFADHCPIWAEPDMCGPRLRVQRAPSNFLGNTVTIVYLPDQAYPQNSEVTR